MKKIYFITALLLVSAGSVLRVHSQETDDETYSELNVPVPACDIHEPGDEGIFEIDEEDEDMLSWIAEMAEEKVYEEPGRITLIGRNIADWLAFNIPATLKIALMYRAISEKISYFMQKQRLALPVMQESNDQLPLVHECIPLGATVAFDESTIVASHEELIPENVNSNALETEMHDEL